MILVDKDIKARASEIFEKGYDENNVKPVSYDVHIKGIIEDDGTVESYRLRPNEVVFIESEEMIKMPLDLMGRIGEKNSRMRQGLHVAGPHYFPGHKTRLFLRVQNISSAEIRIKKGDSIAQIFLNSLQIFRNILIIINRMLHLMMKSIIEDLPNIRMNMKSG